jgi:hydroxymethylpyrimidine/phosphomethylpyrimidine kinase
LSIAGSDPSGGAGIQADLKTFSALGCYGMAAMTALTAQNTKGVSGIHEVPAVFVAQQLEAIFSDIQVDAVKIGMAGSVETIQAIASILKKYKPAHIVLDPVMVAQSGDKLLSDESIDALKTELIPLASVLTPNIPEALVLLNSPLYSPEEMAKDLLKSGSQSVLLKGGHGEGAESNDVYADQNQTVLLKAARIDTKNNHGTGCTLSSAIACYLAQENESLEAARLAKAYITKALEHSNDLNVGHGHGPVHHFHGVWE